MEIRRGDIYWIEMGECEPVGCIQYGDRPAIIVSNDKNNEYSNVVEIVYLTKSPKKPYPTHCAIISSKSPSTALCEQIHSVPKENLGNYVGTCTKEEMDNVDRCIMVSLGIDPTKALDVKFEGPKIPTPDFEKLESKRYKEQADFYREELERYKHRETFFMQTINNLRSKSMFDNPAEML